jgi:hypothetical protein
MKRKCASRVCGVSIDYYRNSKFVYGGGLYGN